MNDANERLKKHIKDLSEIPDPAQREEDGTTVAIVIAAFFLVGVTWYLFFHKSDQDKEPISKIEIVVSTQMKV